MGFKCRLFGHTYGNPEVERSRKEDGDEVVVTIRNVKRCERCGDEKMVNQTKEVTSVRSPEEVGLDDAEEAPATPEPAGGTDADSGTAEPADGDSPVTPVEPAPPTEPTAEIDDAVDATVGADAEPVAEATAEPAAGGTADGAEGASAESGADTGADADDRSGTGDGWDEDAVVEDPDVPMVEPAADSPGVDEVAEPDASTVAADEESSTAEAAAEPDDGWETGSDDWDDVDPDPDVDDAVILDAAETEHDEVQWPEDSDADPEATTGVDDPTADGDAAEAQAADDAPTTDAEIIDAGETEADPAGGSTGGWPEHEDTGAAGGWPEHDAADEGYSASPNSDVDAEFGGSGLTPEVNGGAPDDSAAVDGITVGGAAAERTRTNADGDAASGSGSGTGEGFVRAGESTTESEVPADRVEFYCPNCEYAQTAGTSSMRAGDICPECKRGYIAERER